MQYSITIGEEEGKQGEDISTSKEGE